MNRNCVFFLLLFLLSLASCDLFNDDSDDKKDPAVLDSLDLSGAKALFIHKGDNYSDYRLYKVIENGSVAIVPIFKNSDSSDDGLFAVDMGTETFILNITGRDNSYLIDKSSGSVTEMEGLFIDYQNKIDLSNSNVQINKVISIGPYKKFFSDSIRVYQFNRETLLDMTYEPMTPYSDTIQDFIVLENGIIIYEENDLGIWRIRYTDGSLMNIPNVSDLWLSPSAKVEYFDAETNDLVKLTIDIASKSTTDSRYATPLNYVYFNNYYHLVSATLGINSNHIFKIADASSVIQDITPADVSNIHNSCRSENYYFIHFTNQDGETGFMRLNPSDNSDTVQMMDLGLVKVFQMLALSNDLVLFCGEDSSGSITTGTVKTDGTIYLFSEENLYPESYFISF